MTTSRLLSVAAMRSVDQAAIAAGTAGITLMRKAGAAVAEQAGARVPAGGCILVLCGPGNNGGDGFVAARLLRAAGYAIRLCLLGDVSALKGDAALAASEWDGPVEPARTDALADSALIIDALFGAGLARDIGGEARELVEAVARAGTPVLAVDVPSGIDGDTGAVRGVAIQAVETVTFVALKPGHLLQPGRAHCGRLHVADIGIEAAALDEGLRVAGPAAWRNAPDVWRIALPVLAPESHKYKRGHALVVSGPATKTGAARLAARGALRIGAGLVTVASPTGALVENAAHLTAIMMRPCDSADDLDDLLSDERLNAVLLGPGLGAGAQTRDLVAVAASAGRKLVLDADALTSFTGDASSLATHLRGGGGDAVLTPHAGEFAKLFGGTSAADKRLSKLERAHTAARRIGATVVLKGADTVIAAADGRAAINDHGTPYLGTAGSGDVLAGLIAGLLAQGMPPFEAACAAVWLHGDAGLRHGPGLIAEDLPDLMPAVLRGLTSGS